MGVTPWHHQIPGESKWLILGGRGYVGFHGERVRGMQAGDYRQRIKRGTAASAGIMIPY